MRNTRLLFGAIADDMTGGLELAAMLIAEGVSCAFVTDPAAAPAAVESQNAQAIVIGQRLRLGPSDRAVAASTEALRALQALCAEQIFYKYCATFDSTPDGNIGPIADMLADATGAGRVLFCPSLPETGCLVFAGHQFRGTVLMSETDKRHDPATPMTDANLVRVLTTQSFNQAGVLPLQTILRGAAAVRAEIAGAAEPRFLIADTVREEDLAVLAEAVQDAPLLTGNAAVARHLPAAWRAAGRLDAARPTPDLPRVSGPGVVLAGSCAARTEAQLCEFSRHAPVHRIDPLLDMDITVARAVAFARTKSLSAIASTAAPEAVAEVHRAFGRQASGERIDAIFARIAAELSHGGHRRFLVAGGETSGAVIDALGITSLRSGPYRAAGLSMSVSEGPEPHALCLKSGKLGPVDMMAQMLAAMETGEYADAV